MPRYLAVRGTSQLEGYHHHLADLLVGANYSAYLAGALVTYFNFRCAWADSGMRTAAVLGCSGGASAITFHSLQSNHLPHRYAAAAGVRNRGDQDWGMYAFWLLDSISDVCAQAGFTSPLVGYQSMYKEAKEKGEWGG
mgnify:CR=1 FL=1